MPVARRTRRRKTVYALMVLLLIASGAEVLARVLLYLDGEEVYIALSGSIPDDSLYQSDDVLPYRLKANHHLVFSHISTNEHGLRGPGFSIQPAPGSYRILTIGGSTTIGSELADDETFQVVIEERLRKTHPSRTIEVLNAGVHGYTSRENLIYLDRLMKFQPNLVLLHDGLNDVNPLTYQNCQPDYSHYRCPLAAPAPRFWWEVSTALRVLAVALSSEYREYATSLSALTTYPNPDEGDSERCTNNFAANGCRPFIANTEGMIRRAQAGNADVLLLTFAYRNGGPGTFHALVNDAIRTIALRESIGCVDIARLLPWNPRYYVDDCHLNAAGARELAIILEGAIDELLQD